MITKAQSNKLQSEATVAVRPKLTAIERGMLTWAVLDPGDKVLDMNPRDGLLLEYLSRHMECEICGVSNHMEHVKQARSHLQNADILYAQEEDIPWRENSFDAVFIRNEKQEDDVFGRVLKETLRVLKPGGQFLLGAVCYPAPLRQLAKLLTSELSEQDRQPLQSKAGWLRALVSAGFQQVTWQQIDLFNGVVIGWKPLAQSKEA